MAKIQPVWALDVGQAALKALKLVPGESPDQVTAEAFDYVEYPKILSQPDADPEQLVREALETFLERNELKGCRVAIAVPGQAGLVKFIKLPPVEKKRIPDIVKFEARQQIPFALEEVVWSYQQIGADEEGEEEEFTMAEVGLFAMKRDQISRAILPFKTAGIEVDIVQMGPIALYNFITFDQIRAPAAAGGGGEAEEGDEEKPSKADKGSIVLLDIGADNTDLIITDGTRIWQRNVPIGGNHFTRALTKELKLTFAKAEHLKRNATKAPDPRSIFTAMRGVFNDFSSEINRSIGFYSSVNRTAKISKVIGLGNGFKLPGLQKFLQQNLSQDVEKLETFVRLTGEDVKTAPQFQENLPSFAVAYGLGVQGLDRSGLRTNLLPPEIEQVRLIRAKKPWALAASALLMLGFTGMFLGDYRVLAKVDNEPFDRAVAEANRVKGEGEKYQADYDAAKGEWQKQYGVGTALVIPTGDRGKWAEFLQKINGHLPDPVRDYQLDPNKASDQPKLDRLRVHIDAVKPVWREDVAAAWFNSLTHNQKALMHPLDRETPPSGAGWIVQIVGHHYNPNPTGEDFKLKPGERQTAFGPYQYLTAKILPSLLDPALRVEGVNHVALAWMTVDRSWTTEKGASNNGLTSTPIPLLARATPPAAATGGGPPGTEAGRPVAAGGAPGGVVDMPRGMPGMAGGMPGMPGMPYNMGMGTMPNDPNRPKLVLLSRTDFLIQFVWQPPAQEGPAKTPEERQAELKTKIAEVTKQMRDAEAKKSSTAVVLPKGEDIEKASAAASREVENALSKAAAPAAPAAGAPPGPGTAAPPGAPAPAPAPAPGPGTPAAPPK
jgi:type IV pilus assembly protein PilM